VSDNVEKGFETDIYIYIYIYINNASIDCASSPPYRTVLALKATAANFHSSDTELKQPLNFLKHNYTI